MGLNRVKWKLKFSKVLKFLRILAPAQRAAGICSPLGKTILDLGYFDRKINDFLLLYSFYVGHPLSFVILIWGGTVTIVRIVSRGSFMHQRHMLLCRLHQLNVTLYGEDDASDFDM